MRTEETHTQTAAYVAIPSDAPPQPEWKPSPCLAKGFIIRDIIAATAGIVGSTYIPALVANTVSSCYWVARSVYSACYTKSQNRRIPYPIRSITRAVATLSAGVFVGTCLKKANQLATQGSFLDSIDGRWALLNIACGTAALLFTTYANRKELGTPNLVENLDAACGGIGNN